MIDVTGFLTDPTLSVLGQTLKTFRRILKKIWGRLKILTVFENMSYDHSYPKPETNNYFCYGLISITDL